ncbi:Auxin-responsive protein SAUR64 [Hirschfeldia incana]|nr:Auxin-responsive protein SAUR64 [Hirschfeldia incana]
MMNPKKLMKMAKKWQQRAALSRKRISFQRSSSTNSSSAVEKGCFVVYTADKARFAFPLSYLSNSVFQEMLKIAEEEFGLPTSGPITLPFDSAFLEYLIRLIERRIDGDTERALLMSISSARCSLPCSLQQQQEHLLTFYKNRKKSKTDMRFLSKDPSKEI